jgi:O-antigen ligase
MIALGLLLLVYFRFTKQSDLAPSPEWWLWWPLVMLLGYIGLQLIPLPEALLQILSPTRAKLLQSLNAVSPGAAYAPISVFPSASLAQLFRVAAYIVVFVLARELAWKTQRRRWVIVVPIIIIAAAEAAMGLLQYDPLMGSYARGTYANQNHFAGLLELALPFAVAYPIGIILKARGRPLRQGVLPAASIAVAALILIGIIFTMSRMAFIATLSSLFVMGSLILAVRTSVLRWLIAQTLLAVILAAAFLYLAPDALIGRFSQVLTTEDVPADVRVHLWSDTRRLAADYALVGCGLGTFEQAFIRYKTVTPQIGVDAAHNDYLQLLVELGGIGFAIAAVSMMSLFLTAVRAIVRNVDPAARYLAIGCVGAFVAILMHSYTDLNLYIPANGMLLAWIAGVVASLNLTAPRVVAGGLEGGENARPL